MTAASAGSLPTIITAFASVSIRAELSLGYSSTGGCGPVVAGFQFHFQASLPQLLHGDRVGVIPYRVPPLLLLFPFSNLLKFLLRGFFLSLDLARLSGRLPPLYILYYFVCPNGPPPIPLLPVPAIWRLVHWHGRLSLDTQRKKKPTINYRSWERVGGHIFLKHTNAKAERATYWAVSLFWGKGLCIHLLAPLDVPKHTQKRIEFNPFFFLSFRISGHPYHVQSIEHFTRIKYRRQTGEISSRQSWLLNGHVFLGPPIHANLHNSINPIWQWPIDQLGPILQWQIMWQKVHSSRTPSTYVAKKSNLSISTLTSAKVLHSPNTRKGK